MRTIKNYVDDYEASLALSTVKANQDSILRLAFELLAGMISPSEHQKKIQALKDQREKVIGNWVWYRLTKWWNGKSIETEGDNQ